ncbi:MAG: nucleotidyltransferase family protein [Bacteroidetes bacterium]|nr:nucleotidyltransferase family protein [Bacteroidota bacterium]
MQVTEAIVLAGGLGTRLREAVPGLPKCMAPVNGKPFVAYVIRHLMQQGITHFIFSLGYKSEAFLGFLSEELPAGSYDIVVEEEPLGTGGAIQYAAQQAKQDDLVVVNGDSLFQTNIPAQAAFHFAHKSCCTLALKAMQNVSRYGSVELADNGSIARFREKQFFEKGLINGGVYLINKPCLVSKQLPQKFSFETDFLQRFYTDGNIYGIEQEGYFIDIGIPEDYQRAQTELLY